MDSLLNDLNELCIANDEFTKTFIDKGIVIRCINKITNSKNLTIDKFIDYVIGLKNIHTSPCSLYTIEHIFKNFILKKGLNQ